MALPIRMMKPAKTFSVMWPASMLANRRTLVRDRPREERQHLDEDDQRQDVDRHALRHEQIEEVQAVAPEAVDQHGEEHRERQRRGDDDVAGDGEGVGDQPDAGSASGRT